MRLTAVCLTVLVAGVACRSSAGITRPPACAEPCCGGNPDGVDCAENPELECAESEDACPGASSYGCLHGRFFRGPLAACTAVDAGGDVDLLVLPDVVGDEVDGGPADGGEN